MRWIGIWMQQGNGSCFLIPYGKSVPMRLAPAASKQMIMYFFSGYT